MAKIDELELAKDMAAMANAYGGNIVVDARGEKGVLVKYDPMDLKEANAARDAFELARRNRLRPSAVVRPEIVEHAGGHLLVVQVEASMGQAIGVRFIHKDELDPSETKKVAQVYGFPVRVGDNTVWFEPEQLPMLTLPELRRTIGLLHKIGKEPVRLHTVPKGGAQLGGDNFWVVEVSVDRNFIRLTRMQGSADTPNDQYIPLDTIDSVYFERDGWRIKHTPGY